MPWSLQRRKRDSAQRAWWGRWRAAMARASLLSQLGWHARAAVWSRRACPGRFKIATATPQHERATEQLEGGERSGELPVRCAVRLLLDSYGPLAHQRGRFIEDAVIVGYSLVLGFGSYSPPAGSPRLLPRLLGEFLGGGVPPSLGLVPSSSTWSRGRRAAAVFGTRTHDDGTSATTR